MHEKNNVAVTSLKQVPALFKKLDWEAGTYNLDIGGGKYDLGTNYLEERGVYNFIYDPFNRSTSYTSMVMSYIRNGGRIDTVTMSNVLNVIEDAEIRHNLLKFAQMFCKGKVYISVYEGDGSGIGKVTKTGSFQANRKYKDYLEEVKAVFGNATAYKGYIIAISESLPKWEEIRLPAILGNDIEYLPAVKQYLNMAKPS